MDFELITKILTKARTKISKGWCQNTSTTTSDKGTVCHCSVYAISKAADETMGADAQHATSYSQTLDFFSKANKLYGIVSWNDTVGRTKKEVLNAFDTAINFAKKGVMPSDDV